jgi:enoyl-[acyl-carrier protein] reductase I
MYRHFTKLAPLQQHVTIEDIGDVAVFLSSDMAAKITGEVLYVDSGYNIIGVPEPPECE